MTSFKLTSTLGQAGRLSRSVRLRGPPSPFRLTPLLRVRALTGSIKKQPLLQQEAALCLRSRRNWKNSMPSRSRRFIIVQSRTIS